MTLAEAAAGTQLSSARLLAALRRRPTLEALSLQAWDAMTQQGDAAGAERWATNTLALLNANAGVACLAALLRLRGSPAALAQVADHATDVCRHAGATAAIACIESWERLQGFAGWRTKHPTVWAWLPQTPPPSCERSAQTG
jgi:nitric oxide reductase NorD protein